MKRITILLTSILAFAANAFEIKHELGVASFEQAPKKVVALDWALTETVMSLGVMPQGIADVAGYNTHGWHNLSWIKVSLMLAHVANRILN